MKTKKLLSVAAALAMTVQLLPGFSAFAEETVSSEPTVVASDKATDWKMSWGWERYEEGFMQHTKDLSVNNGFSLVFDREKFKSIDAVKFPANINKEKVEATGEYKYAYRVDSNGNPVAYSEGDITSETKLWYHQGRNSYRALFAAGETENDGRPIVVSYKYYINTGIGDKWNAPKLNINDWFYLYTSTGKPLAVMNGSSAGDTMIQTAETEDGWHDVKFVVSPEVTDGGQIEMTAISVDGNVQKLSGIYSKTGKTNDDIKLSNIIMTFGLQTYSTVDDEVKIKDLTVTRGVGDITASSEISDGSKDVVPENIAINFSDAVELGDSVKVYRGSEALPASSYTVTQSDDKKTAYVTLTSYSPRTEYTISVDKNSVHGMFGESLTNDLSFSFVTKKAQISYQGSQNLVNSDTKFTVMRGADGQYFTDVKNENGVVTITVDNQAWQDSYNIKKADKNGTERSGWVDLDGDGVAETIIGNAALGYGDNWKYSGVIINVSETENNGKPIYVSFDYETENAYGNEWGSGLALHLKKGRAANLQFASKNASLVYNTGWNSSTIIRDQAEKVLHRAQLVLNPKYEYVGDKDGKKEGKAKITMYGVDNTIITDEKVSMFSQLVTPDSDGNYSFDSSDLYISNPEIRTNHTTTNVGADGKLLPTVIKLSNIKILRAEDFEISADDSVVTSADPKVKLLFSDPIKYSELEKIKIYKGVEEVTGAIGAPTLSDDGMSATLPLTLTETARYTLDVSELEDMYTVKSKTETISIEYYNNAMGAITIANTEKTTDNTDSVISYTLSSTLKENKEAVVIAAAYGSDNSLISVKTKTVTIGAESDLSDTITVSNVTGAVSYQLMVWDSVDGMKPYCLAKDLK